MADLYTLFPTDNYLPEKGVSTKAEFHIQNTECQSDMLPSPIFTLYISPMIMIQVLMDPVVSGLQTKWSHDLQMEALSRVLNVQGMLW